MTSVTEESWETSTTDASWEDWSPAGAFWETSVSCAESVGLLDDDGALFDEVSGILGLSFDFVFDFDGPGLVSLAAAKIHRRRGSVFGSGLTQMEENNKFRIKTVPVVMRHFFERVKIHHVTETKSPQKVWNYFGNYYFLSYLQMRCIVLHTIAKHMFLLYNATSLEVTIASF